MIQGFGSTPKTKSPKPPLQPVDSTGREFCGPPLTKITPLVSTEVTEKRCHPLALQRVWGPKLWGWGEARLEHGKFQRQREDWKHLQLCSIHNTTVHFKSPAIPNCKRRWGLCKCATQDRNAPWPRPLSLRPFLVAWPTPILRSIFLFLNKKSVFLSILICPWSNCFRTQDSGSLSEYTLDLIHAYHLRTTKFSEIYVLVCTGFWFWFWFFK